jgi:hypothetical protein
MRNWFEWCLLFCTQCSALSLLASFSQRKAYAHICKYMYHVMDAAAALTEEILVMKTLELKQ